jgi:Cu2+-exporting ATPase
MRASREVVLGIRRCFIASLLYNAITISLAIAGLIHPLIAALFMPLSGLTVLTMALNSRTFISKRKKGKTET